MGQSVGIIPVFAAGSAPQARPVAGDVGAPAVAVTTVPGPAPADLRLIIEEDQVHGGYVYKTLDRATGEIVKQFPREEVLRIGAEEDYEAGEIVASTV